MKIRIPLAVLGLAGFLAGSSFAADDVEVLAKGPVHEAYADPSEANRQRRLSFPKNRPS